MRLWLPVALLVMTTGIAASADKFENKEAGVSVELPAGYVKASEVPAMTVLGNTLGAWKAANADDTGAGLLVHLLEIPGGLDYDAFKKQLPDLLKSILGENFKLLKQDDTKVEQMTGFLLDFQAPSDGRLPDPNGKVISHVRWYFFKEPDNKVLGVLYIARDTVWKDVEPKVDESSKTLKHLQ